MARRKRTEAGEGTASPRAWYARLRVRARENRRLIVVLVCLTVFLLLMGRVLAGGMMRIDRWAHVLIVDGLRAPWLTPVMEAISALATPVSLVAMLLVIAAFAPGRRPGWCCAVNLALATLLNVGLKALVQRPRPDEALRLVTEHGYSFPSGHSMAAMAFFGMMAWYVWRFEPDRTRRLALCCGFAVLVALVGISRIYLGVHYASDVIGGFCASLIWLAFYTRVVAPLLLGDTGRAA